MAVPSNPAPVRGPTDPQDALSALGGSWLWTLGLALTTLAAGVVVLVWPQGTLQVVAVVVGLQLLVTGVFRFVAAFSRNLTRDGGRVTGLIVAVLAVLAGVLCLRNPLQTVAALALIVGAFWLLSGVLTTFVALTERGLAHRAATFATGVLGIIAGVVVLSFPVDSAVVLARLLGLWLLLLGLAELAASLALRSLSRRTAARTAGAAAARGTTTGGRTVGSSWTGSR